MCVSFRIVFLTELNSTISAVHISFATLFHHLNFVRLCSNFEPKPSHAINLKWWKSFVDAFFHLWERKDGLNKRTNYLTKKCYSKSCKKNVLKKDWRINHWRYSKKYSRNYSRTNIKENWNTHRKAFRSRISIYAIGTPDLRGEFIEVPTRTLRPRDTLRPERLINLLTPNGATFELSSW